ncbi:class I SAM-dependent methyltransferase [Oricola thermophila]|uniref:Class I SAM-dependent methyltransferase n=2 Tax=Oricola thermophila TaxID=2742145 RepID=A0A6N1VIW8_9HYPH|nr:class I SAM-dependent methyltransferase [Oricola thermophila]
MRAKARILFEAIETRPGLAAVDALAYLDVGCGVGSFHPYVAGRFAQVSGCDVSGESIEKAKAANPEVAYQAYDGGRLPYGDRQFDVLTAICVVHHVPPSDWPDFFSELRRVLKPGGIACIIEHNPFNPLTRLAVARCPFDEDAVLLSPRRTRGLLAGAGFSALSTRQFLFLPWENRVAVAVERALARVPLGAQYVAIGEA